MQYTGTSKFQQYSKKQIQQPNIKESSFQTNLDSDLQFYNPRITLKILIKSQQYVIEEPKSTKYNDFIQKIKEEFFPELKNQVQLILTQGWNPIIPQSIYSTIMQAIKNKNAPLKAYKLNDFLLDQAEQLNILQAAKEKQEKVEQHHQKIKDKYLQQESIIQKQWLWILQIKNENKALIKQLSQLQVQQKSEQYYEQQQQFNMNHQQQEHASTNNTMQKSFKNRITPNKIQKLISLNKNKNVLKYEHNQSQQYLRSLLSSSQYSEQQKKLGTLQSAIQMLISKLNKTLSDTSNKSQYQKRSKKIFHQQNQNHLFTQNQANLQQLHQHQENQKKQEQKHEIKQQQQQHHYRQNQLQQQQLLQQFSQQQQLIEQELEVDQKKQLQYKQEFDKTKINQSESRLNYQNQLNQLVLQIPEIQRCQIDSICEFIWIRTGNYMDYYCPMCDEWGEELHEQVSECVYCHLQAKSYFLTPCGHVYHDECVGALIKRAESDTEIKCYLCTKSIHQALLHRGYLAQLQSTLQF